MSSRKQCASLDSEIQEERNKSGKSKENQTNILHLLCYALPITIFLSLWLLLLLYCSAPRSKPFTQCYIQLDRKLAATATAAGAAKATKSLPSQSQSTCRSGAWVYSYELPPEFNLGLLDDCRHLNMHRNMCPHVANRGLGQPLSPAGNGSFAGSSSSSSPGGWFATNQFTSEMLFHARMENHPCRTRDPTRARLFYLPFYGGLYASSKFREANLTARDALVTKLVDYVGEQPWWRRRHGHDHFLVLGRTAWDFMRQQEPRGGPDYGASSLLSLPRVRNISALMVERHPWLGPKSQHGIPYPSYFHPSTSEEMLAWQDRVRSTRRPHLFSFVGAPRIGLRRAAARNEVIRQCDESARCELLQCGYGEGRCSEPGEVMGVMMASEFCLQPVGDSSTRRSTFDSILAGCIPVFFSPHAAYNQYKWFLPREPSAYSVLIELAVGPETNVSSSSSRRIEEELGKIPAERVREMRSAVVGLIPAVTYAHPNASGLGFRDAVDVALDELSKHVGSKLSRQ